MKILQFYAYKFGVWAVSRTPKFTSMEIVASNMRACVHTSTLLSAFMRSTNNQNLGYEVSKNEMFHLSDTYTPKHTHTPKAAPCGPVNTNVSTEKRVAQFLPQKS